MERTWYYIVNLHDKMCTQFKWVGLIKTRWVGAYLSFMLVYYISSHISYTSSLPGTQLIMCFIFWTVWGCLEELIVLGLNSLKWDCFKGWKVLLFLCRIQAIVFIAWLKHYQQLMNIMQVLNLTELELNRVDIRVGLSGALYYMDGSPQAVRQLRNLVSQVLFPAFEVHLFFTSLFLLSIFLFNSSYWFLIFFF